MSFRRASMSVQYELFMFNSTLVEMMHMKPVTPYEKLLFNALLQSFLIAVRNLHEFLYPNIKRKPTDLASNDFFTAPDQWRPLPMPDAWANQQVIRIIHKSMAHLTWHRARKLKPDWEPLNIALAITPTLGRFLETASPRRIDSQLKDSFGMHKDRLRKLCKKNRIDMNDPPTKFVSFVSTRF